MQLERFRRPVLRLSSFLLGWIGLSCAAPFVLAPIIVGYLHVFKTRPLPSAHQLLVVVPQLVVGLLLLWMAHRCWSASGGVELQPRRMWHEFVFGVRAVLRPRADDLLHDWIIRVPVSQFELRAQLKQEAPRVSFWRALWLRLNDQGSPVVALMEEKNFVFNIQSRRSSHQWRGQWAENAHGMILRGRIQMSCFERIYWAFIVTFFIVFEFLGLTAVVIKGFLHGDTFVFCAVTVFMWSALLCLFRVFQFWARQQERQLEPFWRERFNAQIELVPRHSFWPWF